MAVNLKDGFVAKKIPLQVEGITENCQKQKTDMLIVPFKTVNCKSLERKEK